MLLAMYKLCLVLVGSRQLRKISWLGIGASKPVGSHTHSASLSFKQETQLSMW